MPIRAVLFDLGNTLVGYYRGGEFHPILRRCLREVTAALGVTMTEAEHEKLFGQALLLNREAEDFSVRPLATRLRQLFSSHTLIETTQEDDICRHFMKPIFACAKLNPAAPKVLTRLRKRNLKTAIVSNTPWGSSAQLWREELMRHSFDSAVAAAIFCMDVGWRKPHPAPMHLALERLAVSPNDAIFVGDDPRWDVEGARRAGLRSILLCPDGDSSADAFAVIHRLEQVLEIVATDAEGSAPEP